MTTACQLAYLEFVITGRCLHEYAPVRAGNGDNMRRKAMGQSTARERGRECRPLQEWERAARKGEAAPSLEDPLFLRLRREVNRVVHSQMTTPDIEAEIVKRALASCTVPQRKARTLRLPEEILGLVEQKQRFLQRWRGARRLCERDQMSRQYKLQAAVVKGAVRAYKREDWKTLL